MQINNYLLLTLGGLGKRFLDANIITPKFLLTFQQKTIMQNILESFGGDFYLIVGLNIFYIDYIKEIKQIIKDSGISQSHIIEIKSSNSQAETAFETLKIFDEQKEKLRNVPLYIINGDTITEKKDLDKISKHMLLNGANGCIEYFYSESKNFSFINFDNNSNVINIEEKVVISKNATTGFYGFETPSLYNEYFTKGLKAFQSNKKNLKEMYISFIYKEMIIDKKKIRSFKTTKDPIILGTPEEYYKVIT